MFWGPDAYGARRLIALLRQLPSDSAIAMSYTEGVAWSMDTELNALTAELVHGLIRMTAATAGAKRHQIPKPLEIQRPYQPQKSRKRKATIDDMALVFGGIEMD